MAVALYGPIVSSLSSHYRLNGCCFLHKTSSSASNGLASLEYRAFHQTKQNSTFLLSKIRIRNIHCKYIKPLTALGCVSTVWGSKTWKMFEGLVVPHICPYGQQIGHMGILQNPMDQTMPNNFA